MAQTECRVCGTPLVNTYRHVRCDTCRGKENRERQSRSPEAYLARVCAAAKSRAKTAGTPFSLTHADLIKLWKTQKGKCAISGVTMTHHINGRRNHDFNVSLDRISPGGPYSLKNVHLVASRVNTLKNDLDKPGLYWWVRTIYEHQGMKN